MQVWQQEYHPPADTTPKKMEKGSWEGVEWSSVEPWVESPNRR